MMSDLRSVNRSLVIPEPNQNLSWDNFPLRPEMPAPWVAPLSPGGDEGPPQTWPEPMHVPGQATATEVLLELHLEPTRCGAFPPPPGNHEALRHLTSPARRAILRTILLKRTRLRSLAAFLYRDPEGDNDSATRPLRNGSSGLEASMEGSLPAEGMGERLKARASYELAAAANLINLLDQLQEMQDYTLSRMGMFSKG
jgi:hypothetical protein